MFLKFVEFLFKSAAMFGYRTLMWLAPIAVGTSLVFVQKERPEEIVVEENIPKK